MSRGGSRPGAGRPARRAQLQQFRRLDVRVLARAGMLEQGAWLCRWMDVGTGSTLATLRVERDVDHLVLHYTLGRSSTTCAARVLQSPCHLGGSRPWLACPACGRRVAILLLDRWRIACGRCLAVSYRSQRVDLCSRLWLKQRRLEARLGPRWSRPERMPQKTYLRIIHALQDCQRRREAWLAGALSGVHQELLTLRSAMRQSK